MEGVIALLGLSPLQALLAVLSTLSASLILFIVRKVYGSIEALESGMKYHSETLNLTSKEINSDMLKIKNQFTDFKYHLSGQVEEVRNAYHTHKRDVEDNIHKFELKADKLTASLTNLSEINDMVKKSFGRVIILEKVTDTNRKDIDNHFKMISKAAERIDKHEKEIKEIKWKK